MRNIIFTLIATVFIFSCQKEYVIPYSKDCAGSEYAGNIYGFWKGKIDIGNVYPTNPYSFLYRTDHTSRIYKGLDTATAVKADGTFSITGNHIVSTYFYDDGSQYSTDAIVDSAFKFIEGKWGGGTTIDGGFYFAVKQ